MASGGIKSTTSMDTNDPDDYATLAQTIDDYMTSTATKGKYRTRWCDVLMMKGATELITYQEMLQELRPRTIIELGSWLGSSAAWFADMAKIFGLGCHVYSLDITNPDAVDKRCHRDSVSFLHGDCDKIEETFTPDMLKGLPHPWLVVDDAHVNMIAVMEYFTAHMLPGDYLVKEDISGDMPSKSGMGLIKELGWAPYGNECQETLAKFMERNADNFLVDRFYCDMFGYNGSFNWNSYLKRV